MKYNIGVIGYGFVGKAVCEGFKGQNIKWFDPYKKGSSTFEEVILDSEFIFLCLPTPFDSKDFSIDISYIDKTVDEIKKYDVKDKIVIIKSTVVPGTTQDYSDKNTSINFVMNPEFLTEKNYLDDFKNTKRIIIGNDSKEVFERMYKFYRTFFKETPILNTTLSEAEIIKYESNVMLASKVALANIFYDICQKNNADYDVVKEGVSLDPRIGSSHIDVTEERGFGGKCFYKDLGSIIGDSKKNDVDCKVLQEIHDYNLRIRKIHDWEDIPGACDKSKEYE